MTALEIVDTAVKIGLGAVISAVSAYGLSHLKFKQDEREARRTRRWDLLQETAADTQEFMHAAGRFSARLANLVGAEHGEVEVRAKAETAFEAERDAFFDAFHLLTNSESRLRLLGEEVCCAKLVQLGDEVRALFSSDGGFREFHADGLKRARVALRDRRDAFFQELSEAYLRS